MMSLFVLVVLFYSDFSCSTYSNRLGSTYVIIWIGGTEIHECVVPCVIENASDKSIPRYYKFGIDAARNDSSDMEIVCKRSTGLNELLKYYFTNTCRTNYN